MGKMYRYAGADVLGLGHSRIPVYRGGDTNNIAGVLMVKKLIVLNPDERRSLKDIPLRWGCAS
jgi:CBS domain containing-hemolysin-like protein